MFDLRMRIAALHKRLGTAGFIVACIALVAALGGTALAARGLFTKAQEKKIAAIAKKFAGKNGAPGAEGKQGPAGPAGPAGANGKDGENGAPGANGKSVVLGNSVSCTAGGISVEVEGEGEKKNVCNGNPAEYPKVLPPGASESGYWNLKEMPLTVYGAYHGATETISFPLPLASHADQNVTVTYLKTGETTEACPSSNLAYEAPQAEPGNLCIYTEGANGAFANSTETHVVFYVGENPTPTGTAFLFANEVESEGQAQGQWTLTAPAQ